MDPLGALRDKARNTRLLVLALLHEKPGASLSDVAKRLDITVQAVSAHAKAMLQGGLLDARAGSYGLSPEGLQTLHDGVRNLHAAVQGLAGRLAVITTTSAVAQEPVEAGQQVVLTMRDGDLACRPGAAGPSRGRAVTAGGVGDEVVVADLEGMVDLRPGRITVVSLPGPTDGGVGRVDAGALSQLVATCPRPDRIGALGTGAGIVARRFGPVHLEFAADQAAFNAAERGLGVLLFATRDRLVEALRTFERGNGRTLRPVPVDVREAPVAA